MVSTRIGGRALAGLALFVSIAGCGSGDAGRGPGTPTQGEAAALMDAEAMLDAREPAEIEANSEEAEAPAQ